MRAITTVLLAFLLCDCSETGKECTTAAECDDSNPCTDDSCRPGTGCVNENNTAICDDDDACTVLDLCSGGECRPGVAVDCDDGNPCTDDSCDPAAGCQNADNTAPCDDQDACTLDDSCQDGACRPGEAVACDDSNECTDDSCDSATGQCVFSNNRIRCDDGDPCSYDDRCVDGACGGTAYSCDDGNLCTDDACTGDGRCSYENNTAACDDRNSCTDPDACQDGVCTGPMICTGEVVVLVYLDGDNDLDANAMEDLAEMEAAGVDDAGWLRVFALYDRSPYSGWTDTRLFEVNSGGRTELDGPALGITAGASLDELNMGDPATLSAFIDDVQALGGTDPQYFLILWNHGDGWRRRSTGTEEPRRFKQVCNDETSDDWLQTNELHTALAGKNLTLVGFDACLEGMVEVAYEIRNDTRIMVASEETEPVEGWDYAGLLDLFMNTGDRSPVYFGRVTVDTFIDSAEFGDVTLSVLDLSRMDSIVKGCNGAAAALAALSTSDWNSLCQQLDWFGGWWPDPHVDMVQLFEKAKAVDGANAPAYDSARTLVENVIIYDRHGTAMPFAHGLAVYFECQSSPDAEYNTANLQWAADTSWDEMLNSH
jgi:hypothetical protein